MKTKSEPTAPTAIVIFGASGDLTRRKLVPSLHGLSCEGLFSPETRVIGLARRSLSDLEFRDRVYTGIEAYARLKPASKLCELWPKSEGRFSYLAGDYGDPSTYHRLNALIQMVAPCSTWQRLLGWLLCSLNNLGMPAWPEPKEDIDESLSKSCLAMT